MSRILLINCPIREMAPPNNPPLGVMYLASVVRNAGHDVEICDLNASRWMINDRAYWLKKHFGDWDFIGLSGLIVTYRQQRWILDFINEHYEEYGCPALMTGGGLASSVPDFVKRKMPEIDIVVRGEGEKTILEIVNGKPLHGIKGINWFNGEKWIDNIDQDLIEDMDSIPYPAWDLVPMEEVYLGNPIWGNNAWNSSQIGYEAKRSANMIVSRGCPGRCSFCFHYVFGKIYRFRTVENVIGEIKTLRKLYDIDFVGMVDDNSTANRKWTESFCEALIQSGLSKEIKWGCSATITQLSTDLCKLMAKAGCVWVGYGVESADPRIRKLMHKPGTPERAIKAVNDVRNAGMWANTTYVLGHPGETLESVRTTGKWMVDNKCLNSVFYATPYPGTELYEIAKPRIIRDWGSEDNYTENLADATDLRVNLTDVSDERLKAWREALMTGQVPA